VAAQADPTARSGFGVGLLICVFSGIFSAMLNFSFVFGKPMQQMALSLGASDTMSANAIWSLALSAGFIINAAYCIYLLQRNNTWHLFSSPKVPMAYWLGAVVMGLVWYGGVAGYGMGAAALGTLGAIWGWPLYMAMTIIAANAWGAATGEWHGASRRSYAYSWMGLAFLIVAIYVISRGGGA
jgi:L-rhamnose-H+ transport protein